MIEYNYDENENIIYVRRIGEICTKDIFDIIEQIHIHFPEKKHLYILQDTTESKMRYELTDLEPMISEFKKRLKTYKSVKIANYTLDPLETATALVFEEMADKVNKLHHKTFTSREFAKHWLQLGMVKD